MKVRPARSFEKAVRRIVDAIGEEVAAKVVKRSLSLVRKWTDPDHPAIPSLNQAYALDEYFVRERLEPPPIHVIYTYRIERLFDELESENESHITALINLNAAVGAMTRTMADLFETAPTGTLKMTPRTRELLLSQLEKVSEETADLERVIRAK